MTPRSSAGALALALATFVAGCGEPRVLDGAPAGGARTAGFALECTTCHGDGDSPAPPRATSGATSTSDRGVGAHAVHLRDGLVARAAACDECHVVPAAVGDAGHQDGEADVVFGALASRDVAERWDPASASCAVYCHGGVAGGKVPAPVWTKVDGSQGGCGACHGLPPPAPHPQGAGACATCHPATVRADGTIDVAGGKHVNGELDVVVQQAACGSCHGIPPATGRHGKHSGRVACGSCHAGASTTVAGPSHLDGAVQVSSPGWNAGARSCANSCHGTKYW